MVSFAVILLGVTLIYTGILTTERDMIIGVAVAIMGIGICIKPLHHFFRQVAESPNPNKVVKLDERSRPRKRRDPKPRPPKRPTIH